MIRVILLLMLLFFINLSTFNLSNIIHPVVVIDSRVAHLQAAAERVGMGKLGTPLIKSILMSSQQTAISGETILALMWTESRLRSQAVSSKNYQGLMQIPWKIPFQNAHILIGAEILKEKLALTKGDIRSAITLYKGWPVGSDRGKHEADKVLMLAKKLKEVI